MIQYDEELSVRVRRLERGNHTVRIALAAALLLAMYSVLHNPSSIKARDFTVRDPAGRPVAVLGLDPAGRPLLRMMDTSGVIRLAVGVGLAGPHVFLESTDGVNRVGISALGGGSAKLSVTADSGHAGAFLEAFRSGDLALSFCVGGGCGETGRGTLRALLAVTADGTVAMTLSDTVDRPRAQVYIDTYGTPRFELLDSLGRRRSVEPR